MTSENNDTIIISEDQSNIRLDKVLAGHFPSQSRTYFQYLIKNQLVLLNGKPIKKRIQAKEEDEVSICFALTPEANLEPEDIPLTILYEDEHLIAVNKPAGMVVHPAPGNWSGTFVNALLYYCKEVAHIDSSLRPGIVHRLDKETSGVLIAAKDISTQQNLIEQFAERRVQKEYLAICIGNPGNVTIDAPIGRNKRNRKKLTIVEQGGKEALSVCSSLFHNNALSIVRVKPTTGRTHQIRVHLKYKGCPILGDATYGNPHLNKKYGAERQMLHAERLQLKHPATGEMVDIMAPLPEDMERIVGKIKQSGTINP